MAFPAFLDVGNSAGNGTFPRSREITRLAVRLPCLRIDLLDIRTSQEPRHWAPP
jgi:hypothetical protein